ncbi:hypothetical protein CONLIGDRAFT_672380 [Coniochaeta ligniaria NRRL 30616]|uniref:Uncharacterized protein n=1 Tax=Coniochaeta ligniaria NRRL 30616 TaxID=1408157 RepID=A0A1J7JH24_9PEZI|nr:hypothetical protein CONLIGDRAFT_672380 [Coniochaeta ligniaria NRRL 30616]
MSTAFLHPHLGNVHHHNIMAHHNLVAGLFLGPSPTPPTTSLPPRGRAPPLEPFLHLPPVRALSRGTNSQWRRSTVRGEQTVPEWRASSGKGGGTSNWIRAEDTGCQVCGWRNAMPLARNCAGA